MEGFPGMRPGMRPGMLPPMGQGMMVPPGMLGMGDLPFPGQGMESRGGEGPLWKRQRTDGPAPFQGPSGASKEGSVFYKTRLCHKFAEGHCPFGERCNYAHGEADLRPLPLEGQQILENRAARMQQEGSPPPTGIKRPDTAPRGDMSKPAMGGGQPGDKAGVRSTAYKSRLCTRFMQTGDCSYGPTCHFAHGYDDMQPPEAQRPGQAMPMESGPFDMPFPRPGMMMGRGGPMMPPPEFMAMAAMGGLPGGPMMPPRPRPPPGPPPGVPGSQQPERQGTGMGMGTPPSFSPERQGFSFDVTRTPTRLPTDVPYLDRVRASCAIMGIGLLKPKDVGSDAVEAAIAALQTGEAFQGNAYADSLDLHVR